MKGLPNKEHYPYKIHTLLMKSRAYPVPPVLLKTLIHDFFKNPSTPPPPPPIIKGRVHTMVKLQLLWVLGVFPHVVKIGCKSGESIFCNLGE